jgi:hypothetical protein
MKKAIFGLAKNEDQARRIVDRFLSSGFSNGDISILYPDFRAGDSQIKGTRKGNLTTEIHSKAPEGAVTGGTTGGILGGSLGLLAGIGSLAIPGFGPFIAAGPILAALSGTAIGSSIGALVGGLIGAGIPEFEAKRYESGLKNGNILISIHTDNDKELKLANDILTREGVEDISTSYENSSSR